MRPIFSFASTMIFGCTCMWVVECSSGSSAGAMSFADGGGASDPVSGGTPVDEGGGSDATSGGDSSTACAPNAGASVPAKWDFAVSAATLNAGKGQVLSIHVCDTVAWSNDDNGTPHSVVSTGGGFDFHTAMATGTTAGVLLGKVQFSSAGTFTYDCGIHGNMMVGEVTVQ